MTAAEIARIRTDSRFLELERKRNAFGWTLCAIMLAAYFAFILLVAFAGPVAATPIWGVVTLAFPLWLGVIVLAIALTGIYVVKANGEYDDLTRQLITSLAQRQPAP